jgi:hypothetical protein
MNEQQIAANPHESLDEDGPPFEITSGPTAGHEHREVIEDECGNCGFDRVLLLRKHGEASKRCLLCNSYCHASVEDEWHCERTHFDELKKLREWADEDDGIGKIGEYGRTSKFFHGTEVFESPGTDLLKIFSHSSSTSTERTTISKSELHQLVQLLEKEQGFVTEHVDEHMDGKKVAPDLGSDNPNAVHAGIIKDQTDEPHRAIRLHLRMNDLISTSLPVHFNPKADGISI